MPFKIFTSSSDFPLNDLLLLSIAFSTFLKYNFLLNIPGVFLILLIKNKIVTANKNIFNIYFSFQNQLKTNFLSANYFFSAIHVLKNIL